MESARRFDHLAGRAMFGLRVLVDARTPMNLAVLRPVWQEMLADHRLDVRFAGRDRTDLTGAFMAEGVSDRVIVPARARLRRWDLYMNADPWDPTRLLRCRRRINFCHGVAGKYDLECPSHLPLNLALYDQIAFPNERRMRRYLEAGLVQSDRAALVGFPKLDRLVNARIPPRSAASALGLPPDRPTAVYAPTFSPQSSLQHGLEIVRCLLETGLNVIVKLHDRSLDPDPRYSGGHDWRRRFQTFGASHHFLFASSADSTEYLLAAELMVTDHSTTGFEFCAINRPVIVFDVPELYRVARIDSTRASLLRGASYVVQSTSELLAAVARALASPHERARERALATSAAFHDPGRATERALALCYGLLECPMLPACESHADRAGQCSCKVS